MLSSFTGRLITEKSLFLLYYKQGHCLGMKCVCVCVVFYCAFVQSLHTEDWVFHVSAHSIRPKPVKHEPLWIRLQCCCYVFVYYWVRKQQRIKLWASSSLSTLYLNLNLIRKCFPVGWLHLFFSSRCWCIYFRVQKFYRNSLWLVSPSVGRTTGKQSHSIMSVGSLSLDQSAEQWRTRFL